jgi:hypothetical protein
MNGEDRQDRRRTDIGQTGRHRRHKRAMRGEISSSKIHSTMAAAGEEALIRRRKTTIVVLIMS